MDVKAILIVDDEYDIASTLEMILSDEGYKVRVAFHGKEALEALNVGPLPHLIISDVMMPVMNGYEFVHKLKEDPKTKDIPVLLTSAAQLNHAQLPKDYIAHFVRKPFNLEGLLTQIKKLLRNTRAHHD